MKRLLCLILALSLTGSLALPALAEGTEDFTACTETAGCTLAEGHTEPCSVPEPKVCETGCILEEGHEGACSVPTQKVCEPGCILQTGHEDACKFQEENGNDGIMLTGEDNGDAAATDKVLCVQLDGKYVTEFSAVKGRDNPSVQFFYFGPDDAPLVLDENAVFTVTDENGTPSSGVVMTSGGWISTYRINCYEVGKYHLVCTLNGKTLGSVDFYVYAGDDNIDGKIPMGLQLRDREGVYSTEAYIGVGSTSSFPIFYDGTQVTDSATNWIYDDSKLIIDCYEGTWVITPQEAGTHTIGYPGGQGVITIYAGTESGPDLSTSPSEDGLYFCWLEQNETKWSKDLRVVNEFKGTLVYVENGVASVADGPIAVSPDRGLNYNRGNGTMHIQNGGNANTYVISYTTNSGNEYSLFVRYERSFDLSNPPVDPGIYFCWDRSGVLMWDSSVHLTGGYCQKLILVQMVDGEKVASEVTDATKLSVSPVEGGAAGGLQFNLFNGGMCELKGITGGNYELIYTVDENTKYRIPVFYDDGMIDLKDAPTIPGLYHAIYDNKYFFSTNKGLTSHNGEGRSFGPLVLVPRNGEPFQLMGSDLLTNTKPPYLRVSPSDGLTLTYNQSNHTWIAESKKADLYTITYVDKDNRSYSATIKISKQGMLYASVDGGATWQNSLTVTEDEPLQAKFAWKNAQGQFVETIGTVHGNNDLLHITRDMNTGIFTVLADTANIDCSVFYHYDDCNSYNMPVFSREAYRLAMKVGQNSNTLVYDYIAEADADKSIRVEFFFGLPSEGLSGFGGDLEVTDGLTLTPVEGMPDGVYDLKILTEGKHAISFTHSCEDNNCDENCILDGKTFTVTVEGVPNSSDCSFFALSGGSSTPLFGSEMIAGQKLRLRLCYGSYGNYQVLTADKLAVNGNAVTISQSGDAIEVAYKSNGQALIQYEDKATGIIHNYVVKCYSGLQDMGMAHYSEQGHNTINVDYNGGTVTVGPALRTENEMWMWPGNSFNHPVTETRDIVEEVVIGAMIAGANNSVTEPADPKFYKRISNMKMSVVRCDNITANTENNVTVTNYDAPVKWGDRDLQMASFYAAYKNYFEADLMISFDLQMGEQTYRFYRPANLSYRELPMDEVSVNIEDADVLNTLLSNSYTLINYLEANDPDFTYRGGDLTLVLPPVAYDKILVSQLMLPGSTDVMGNFTIRGSEDESGNRTTVPGIYSKGFLHEVQNIDFVADPDVTMRFDGEEFTCGLLVDNTRTSFQPDFDLATLKAYHPEFHGLSNTDAQNKYDNYAPSVITGSNSYNIHRVAECSFDGFEYAMRTDKGGFVHGAHGCTIKHCKYGVYINAGGVNTLHTDGRSNTIWRDNQFIENWAAVRITGLPDDLSSYYIRFIDNDFYRNNKEFWVTARGQYYFYRNYYSGHWNALYWQNFWKQDTNASADSTMLLTVENQETARPAYLTVDTETTLVTNPCRSKPGSSENLWIFDTDDLQKTVILQSEADTLKVDSDAIANLGETLDIPVLNDEQKRVGVWTIYEGGDDQ